jgi:Tol biopolymer transport system component
MITRAALVTALALACAPVALAQARDEQPENYAIFVSRRGGAAELFLINLESRQVSQLTETGRGHLAASIAPANRTIVYAAREGASYELFCGKVSAAWRTRRPAITALSRLTVNTTEEISPSITADGALMAFASGGGIELMNLNDQTRRVLVPSADQYADVGPAISPDGSCVAFVSNRGGAYEIWLYSNATGQTRALTGGAAAIGGLSWSADGKQLAFTTAATSSKLSGIALANADTGAFRVLTDGNDFNASIAARGDRLLFTSMRDGDAELYLLNLATGRIDRLTHSAGADDGAVFLADPVRPSRQTR